jgi:hypothetical protein
MAAAGVPSFSAPDVGLPSISGGGSGGGGGGGGSARTGGGGGGSYYNDFSLGAIDSSFSGDLFSLEALGQRTLQDVVNITVNTVTADANLPTLIVEALQQYNLVNGPADFQIAI